MSYKVLQQHVLDVNLCTGCGVCSSACPQQIISYNLDKITPIFSADPIVCKDCHACYEVCPGKSPETEKHELNLYGRTRTEKERWLGIFSHAYAGRSTDEKILEKSASGGSTTALLGAAMRYLSADFALIMGRDQQEPWRSAPVFVDNPDKLGIYSQSTYQLAPFLSKLHQLYFSQPNAKLVTSGIACHVQAIRKLQAHDSDIGRWAKSQIVFIVEIGCSSNTLPKGTKSLVQENFDIPLENITDLKYRDGIYPGQIAVYTTKNEKLNIPFWQAVRHFKENKTFRCLSCGDWISGLADISVADGDPNIFDASLGLNTIEKHGRILVRTRAGAEVLRYADSVGKIEIWPTALDGMNLGLERKRNRRATYERKYSNIPDSPIKGYCEDIEVVDDAKFLALPDERESAVLTRT